MNFWVKISNIINKIKNPRISTRPDLTKPNWLCLRFFLFFYFKKIVGRLDVGDWCESHIRMVPRNTWWHFFNIICGPFLLWCLVAGIPTSPLFKIPHASSSGRLSRFAERESTWLPALPRAAIHQTRLPDYPHPGAVTFNRTPTTAINNEIYNTLNTPLKFLFNYRKNPSTSW